MMATYMLNPRFLEESRNKNIEATGYTEFITFTDKSFDQEKFAKLFIELIKFHQKISLYNNETIQISSSNLNLSIWWQSQLNSKLQQLAIKILSIPISSVAAERNFSTFRFIHNKICNRLCNEHVKKLVYIYENLQIYDRFKKIKPRCKRNKKSARILNKDIEEE